ncbi:hypothetical protein CRENBAI_020741 [Crenichthys baileyi]|uniref:Uncharacterized protein n=1 Tax=Crenichthys baileyi TaxID=28760 RepID=A0AAV9R6N8_9TELE
MIALMLGRLEEIMVSRECLGPSYTWPTGPMGVNGALILVTPVQGENYSLETSADPQGWRNQTPGLSEWNCADTNQLDS